MDNSNTKPYDADELAALMGEGRLLWTQIGTVAFRRLKATLAAKDAQIRELGRHPVNMEALRADAEDIVRRGIGADATRAPILTAEDRKRFVTCIATALAARDQRIAELEAQYAELRWRMDGLEK